MSGARTGRYKNEETEDHAGRLYGEAQYGVSGANYNVDSNGDLVRIVDSVNTYDMNLIYTGDVFKAAFCSEIAWTQAAKDFGILQNNDSIVD